MIHNNFLNSPANNDKYFSNALMHSIPLVEESPHITNKGAFSIENTPNLDVIDEKNSKVQDSLFKLCLTNDLLDKLDEVSPVKEFRDKNKSDLSELKLVDCKEEENSVYDLKDYNNLSANNYHLKQMKERSFSNYSTNSSTISSRFSMDLNETKKNNFNVNSSNTSSQTNSRNSFYSNQSPNDKRNYMDILNTFQKGFINAKIQAKAAISVNEVTPTKTEKPKVKRAGWTCLSCSNFNYESRNKCNRCSKPIKDNVLSSSTKTSEDNSPRSNTDDVESSSKSNEDLNDSNKKKKFIERIGDWMCSKCKNLNFAFRETCNRCNTNKCITVPVTVPTTVPISVPVTVPVTTPEKLQEQGIKNMMMFMQYNQMMQWHMKNNLNKMNINNLNNKNQQRNSASVPLTMPMGMPFPVMFKSIHKDTK